MLEKQTLLIIKLVAAVARSSAFAQSAPPSRDVFPSMPIRLIVPFAPGGGSEVGRVVMQSVSSSTGQQIVIDNRGGAGGLIGAGTAARAAPMGTRFFSAGRQATAPIQIRTPSFPIIPSGIFLP